MDDLRVSEAISSTEEHMAYEHPCDRGLAPKGATWYEWKNQAGVTFIHRSRISKTWKFVRDRLKVNRRGNNHGALIKAAAFTFNQQGLWTVTKSFLFYLLFFIEDIPRRTILLVWGRRLNLGEYREIFKCDR